jgi:HAD superfamily hydrolase (TIGR01549 family)
MSILASELKALICDLDGVLIDSRPQMGIAFEKSYRQHFGTISKPPTDRFFSYMGLPLPDILRRMGLPKEMYETYREISRSLLNYIELFPGIFNLLDDVKNLGMRIGLSTGKDRQRTLEILGRFELTPYFEFVVCGDDPFPGKPDPYGLNLILSQLRVRPAQAVFVGDSPLDIHYSRMASVIALGAEWGFSSREELVASGARVTFHSVSHLNTWLTTAANTTRLDIPLI